MADQFLGEIRVFPFNFPPTGWALCDGQVLPIQQNTALFSLLGTNFGGNGTSTFALPNMQGRFPVDAGNGPGLTLREVGEADGTPSVTLTASQLPPHSHAVACASAGGVVGPGDALFANTPSSKPPAYAPLSGGAAVAMSPAAVAQTGSGLPHDNMPPYLVMNFCIALTGIFPARS
jgi:microcystin-dependent protein